MCRSHRVALFDGVLNSTATMNRARPDITFKRPVRHTRAVPQEKKEGKQPDENKEADKKADGSAVAPSSVPEGKQPDEGKGRQDCVVFQLFIDIPCSDSKDAKS